MMNEKAGLILRLIDEHRAEILAFADDIQRHAEMGYREYRTAGAFAEKLRGLGLRTEEGLAVTGVRAVLGPGKAETATVALLGEMDALAIPASPYCWAETGAAHCCGHHAQLAGVYGAAIALTDPRVAQALDGRLLFMGVPAEEYGELEWKKQLMHEGKIVYGGGKCELIRIGAFDDVQVCVAHHTGFEGIQLGGCSGNGFLSKIITYTGKASHAAAAPDKGVNALNAAALGLQAVAMNRETFRDQDCVRVHPIMTDGGSLVNVVPDRAVIETLVRGKTNGAIEDAAWKTDRSFLAGALALGAGCTIETMPGYLPYLSQETPEEIVSLVRNALPEKQVSLMDTGRHSAGSSDVGDLQHLLPVLSFKTGGAAGSLHSAAFDITDPEEAYIVTAKIFALHALALLENKAALARRISAAYHPVFPDRDAYVRYMDGNNRTFSCPDPARLLFTK